MLLIDFITIATKGDSQDFGDLTEEKHVSGGCSSTTRGIFAGGVTHQRSRYY